MTESARQKYIVSKNCLSLDSRELIGHVYTAVHGHLLLLIWQWKHKKPIIVVTADTISAVNLINELNVYIKEASSIPIITFPDWETLPYDLFSLPIRILFQNAYKHYSTYTI